MRRLFNVVFSPHSTVQPEVILNLDAEKAFNRIKWTYLFAAWEKFGMGPTFCWWIRVLYSTPWQQSGQMAWSQNTFCFTEAQDSVAVCHPSCLKLQLNNLQMLIDQIAGLAVYSGVKLTIKPCLMLMICFRKYQTQLRAFPPSPLAAKFSSISGYRVI